MSYLVPLSETAPLQCGNTDNVLRYEGLKTAWTVQTGRQKVFLDPTCAHHLSTLV